MPPISQYAAYGMVAAPFVGPVSRRVSALRWRWRYDPMLREPVQVPESAEGIRALYDEAVRMEQKQKT